VFQIGDKDKAAGGDGNKLGGCEKRKAEDTEPNKDLKKVGVRSLLNSVITAKRKADVMTPVSRHPDVTA
jgi:hypothetical protein